MSTGDRPSAGRDRLGIELNGEAIQVAAGTTVASVVVASGADPATRGLAVAVGGEVIPRSRW